MTTQPPPTTSTTNRRRKAGEPDAAPRPAKRQGRVSALADSERALGLIMKTPHRLAKVILHPFGGPDPRPTDPAEDAKMPVNFSTQRERLSIDTTHVMEIFIPAYFYKTNPDSILPDSGDHPDSTVNYRRLLYVLAFLANTAHAPIKIATVVVADNGRESTKMTTVDSPNHVMLTFERVPHKDNPNIAVGYRFRLTEQSKEPGLGFIGVWGDKLAANDDMRQKQFQGIARRSAEVNPASHTLITNAVWRSLCIFYAGPGILYDNKNTDRQYVNNSRNPQSIYNLCSIFSIKRSLDCARNLDADPRYCDEMLYMGETAHGANCTLFGFAEPKNTWLLGIQALSPLTIEEMMFPMRRLESHVNDRARANYAKMLGERAGAQFDGMCSETTSAVEENDIKTLTRRVSAGTAKLASDYGAGTNVFFVQLRLLQALWNINMSEIIHTHGCAAPAVQAIAGYRDSYLQQNRKSLKLETTVRIKNLSRFGDMMCYKLALMETIGTVLTSHKSVLLKWYSVLSVFFRSMMNVHHLNVGGPGNGKSFEMHMVMSMMISGTYMLLTTFTDAAFKVPGRINDSLALFFEDPPASVLGANAANKGGKGAVSDDRINGVKNLLTSNETNLLTIEMDPKRKGTHVKADTCIVAMFAMNDSTDCFDSAILSRLHVQVTPEQLRPGEWPDSVAIQMRMQEPAVKIAMEGLKLISNVTQVISCEIGYRIASGLLHDVTMDGVMIFFGLIGAYAKKHYGIDMSDKRKCHRLKQIVRQLVVDDTAHLIHHSPLSPIASEEEHDIKHFLMYEKHLVAKKEHLTVALGMVIDGYYNKTVANVINTMKKHFFPDADAKIARLKQPFDEAENDKAEADLRGMTVPANVGPNSFGAAKLTEDERAHLKRQKEAYDGMKDKVDYWMYDTCQMPSHCLSAPKGIRGQAPSVNDICLHVAQALLPHLNPRPTLQEVEAIIRNLTKQTYEEKRTVRDNAAHQEVEETKPNVYVMLVEENCIRLSLRTLENSAYTDGVYASAAAVNEMLFNCAPGKAESETLLWGDTDPSNPFVWRTITSRRRAAGAPVPDEPLRVWNTRYHDEGLIQLTRTLLQTLDEKQASTRLGQLFDNDTPWYNVDVDLDEYAARLHATELGLCEADQHASPSNDTHVQEAQLQALGIEERDLVYPQCFKSLDRDAWSKDMVKRQASAEHGKNFLLSEKNERLKQLQQTFAPIVAPGAAAVEPALPALPDEPADMDVDGGDELAELEREIAENHIDDEEDEF